MEELLQHKVDQINQKIQKENDTMMSGQQIMEKILEDTSEEDDEAAEMELNSGDVRFDHADDLEMDSLDSFKLLRGKAWAAGKLQQSQQDNNHQVPTLQRNNNSPNNAPTYMLVQAQNVLEQAQSVLEHVQSFSSINTTK